jgi:putative permease
VLKVLKDFYQTYLSDPQAALLVVLIVVGFTIVLTMGGMLLPVIAGIVIAYLLDDLGVKLKQNGIRRRYGVWIVYLLFVAVLLAVIFGLIPLLSAQVSALVRELPQMIAHGQRSLQELPKTYPFIDEQQLNEILRSIQVQMTQFGQQIVSFSLNRIPGLFTAVVYLVLMPLLVFFFLKDKWAILIWANRFVPEERELMTRLWKEMDRQLGNYVRGKFWEALIVGVAAAITLSILGMNYWFLLGVAIGISVIIPYVGAVLVTLPVVFIAYFQWGWSAEFAYAMIAYGILQALDGAVLVPIMFSEVVNLHPIAIIVAVLVFGGLWGFWGVFFAIPLATFVQALITAWPRSAPGATA